MSEYWHNEEAVALAKRIQNVLNAQAKGAICPNEFLCQLSMLVDEAVEARLRMIDLHQVTTMANENKRRTIWDL